MKISKKILIGIVTVIVALLAIVSIVWHNEISSYTSIEKIIDRNHENEQGSTYSIDISGDYYFDKFIEQGGVENDAELLGFVTENITKGVVPLNIKQPEIGCSAFTATLPNGDVIFARNYDFFETNSAVVYTEPSNSLKSVSSVDLHFLDIPPENDVDTLMDKMKMLSVPYVPLDGLNEAGLAVGIFMTYQGAETVATNQSTDKPDLTSTTMLRLILDNATTVDEAVELIEQYDLHDSAGTSFQYMVADASGNSAVLEWVYDTDATDNDGTMRELVVTYNDDDAHIGDIEGACDYQWITNFIIVPDYYADDAEKQGLDRYDLIGEELTKRNGIVADEYDAMSILEAVGRRDFGAGEKCITVHSVVYNLTQKTMVWVGNENYEDTSDYITYSFAD